MLSYIKNIKHGVKKKKNVILKEKVRVRALSFHFLLSCIVFFVFRNMKLWVMKSSVPGANTVTHRTWISPECQTCFKVDIRNVEWYGILWIPVG